VAVDLQKLWRHRTIHLARRTDGRQPDTPGVIGTVGTTFGKAGINIADMVISRDFQPDGTALALMVLKTDSQPGAELVKELRDRPGILRVKSMRVAAHS
jgi:D-3-phosphoglycerate dehydrogenase